MSMFEDTNPRELKELLRQIDSGETVLPDFQRDFVWDPNATQELIVSVANNYPAGSLLRIRNTQNLFAYRQFQAAPQRADVRPTYLVLDGQQRLTSLYQAFYGVGENRFFVDLRKLLETQDFEESIFHLKANTRRAVEYANLDVQARELVVPLGILRGGRGSFSRWSLDVARRAASNDERISLEDRLRDIEDTWIQTIDDYRFPVVTLSDSTSAEAVCTIFETLNRTGVRLSPFELLTARFWHQNVNLRQRWAAALEDFPIIADFDVDPYYALQIITLLARRPSCKRSEVLQLSASDIEEWWDSAIWGLAKGLELLRGDCGVLTPRWLPYYTMLIPLAAVLGRLGLTGTPEVGANKLKLTRWFWCSVLGQVYENAANTRAGVDVPQLNAWLEGGSPPDSVSSFRFDPNMLRDTTSRQRGLYRGLICLILKDSPRDFYSYDRLTPDLLSEHGVEDHHIFPYAYLGRENVPTRLRDCVLNRTLIDRTTNRRISDRAPSDYLSEIAEVYAQKGLGESALTELLASHKLPGGPDSPLLAGDFEAFLDWRQARLWESIKVVTGVTEAAELMSLDVLVDEVIA